MDTDLDLSAAVVAGYDGSVGAELALDWAYDHAHLEQRPLAIFHATRSSSRQDALLDRAAQRIRVPGGPEVRTVTHHGGARAGLVGVSREAAVLVVGATGVGALASTLLGSVAQAVVKGARCPVVVRRSPATGLRSVLIGTDCDPRSDPALAFAFRVAATRSCPLTVLRCLWDVTRPAGDVTAGEAGYDLERKELMAAIEPHAARHPQVEVHPGLSRGFADRRLIRATREHDLVVIGHHTMPLLDTVVWGNVAPVVVREAAGDVAVVPAGFGDDPHD